MAWVSLPYVVTTRDFQYDDLLILFKLSTLSLCLHWHEELETNPVKSNLLATVSHLAPSLERLTLEELGEIPNANLIMRFHFPNLKSIKLGQFCSVNDGREAMNFWRQHPKIESISIIKCMGRWFTNEVDSPFLPNLRHLKVNIHFIWSTIVYISWSEIGHFWRRASSSSNSSSPHQFIHHE